MARVSVGEASSRANQQKSAPQSSVQVYLYGRLRHFSVGLWAGWGPEGEGPPSPSIGGTFRVLGGNLRFSSQGREKVETQWVFAGVNGGGTLTLKNGLPGSDPGKGLGPGGHFAKFCET